MKLTDLKRKIEPAISIGGPDEAPEMPSEVYPYGLQIRLNEEEIEKLGIDLSDLSIEQKVGVVANGMITEIETAISADPNMHGTKTRKRQCLAIQFTGLALGKPVKESSQDERTEGARTLRSTLANLSV